jgi:hypothetical protein
MVLITSALILSCIPTKNTGQVNTIERPKSDPITSVSEPAVIIYKMTRNYSQFVPIIMSDDKKSIVSYPDVKDVFFKGKLAYPTPLHNGYWLDNRGISQNAVFTRLTYEAYSKLPVTPSPENLKSMITDYQPIKRMYSCGKRSSYKNIEKELNEKIDSGNFSDFTKIK